MCASSTLAAISIKVAGTTFNFKHSMIQSFFMNLGEYLNILLFAMPLMTSAKKRHAYFSKLTKEAIAKKQDLKGASLLSVFPSLVDGIATGLGTAAILLLPASIAQMLRGGQIISTCIFARIINKRAILRHQLVGVIISTAGFFVVGLAGYISTNDEGSKKYSIADYMLGILIIIIHLALAGLHLNLEERIMVRYAISPQRLAGLQGIFGMVLMAAIVSSLAYVPCLNPQLCNIHGYMEDAILAINDISKSSGLLCWTLLYIISVAILNFTAVHVTQLTSSVFRIFWKTMAVILVWIICVAVGFEKLNPLSSSIQVLGFVMLMISNLTYNGFLKFRCLGISDNTNDGKKMSITDKYVPL